jgi:hypothetical protein
MVILGLDMSTQKTGYAIFQDKQLIDYGCFELLSSDEKDWRKRITYMANEISGLMKRYKIDKIYIEDVPPIINNSQTVKTLGALQGIVLGVTSVFGIEVEFIPVETWKTKININLSHSKEYNQIKKSLKGNSRALEKLKGRVKAYEKKMSIDLANNKLGTELLWKSFSSKQNDDDIADAINIVASAIYDNYTYALKDYAQIIQELNT